MSKTRRLGDRAVVIGASIAGLLAARVLSEFYGEVLVLDRDRLPGTEENRRAVPQGQHLHALLSRGATEIEALFPGILDELVSRGAPVLTDYAEFMGWFGGHRVYPGPGARPDAFYQASRPCLEARIRARVRELASVTLIDRCAVSGLLASADSGRVTGIRLDGPQDEISADLVVDCSGRTGRTPVWLTELGYEPPREERVAVDLRYVSQLLRVRQGALGPLKFVFDAAHAGQPRGVGMCAVEDDRWLLTLVGYPGNHPPTEREDFLAFLDTVAPADVAVAVRQAEPVTEVVATRYPATLRRRYDKLRQFPEGLLVLGDAMCSFNPVYGQGMTIAVLQASALRECLRRGPDRLAHRFFRAAARPVSIAWRLTVAADLDLAEVRRGQRAPLPVKLINGYLRRLQAEATHDKHVADAIIRAITLIDPPARLFRPHLLRAAIRPRRPRPMAAIGARSGQWIAARRPLQMILASLRGRRRWRAVARTSDGAGGVDAVVLSARRL